MPKLIFEYMRSLMNLDVLGGWLLRGCAISGHFPTQYPLSLPTKRSSAQYDCSKANEACFKSLCAVSETEGQSTIEFSSNTCSHFSVKEVIHVRDALNEESSAHFVHLAKSGP